MTRTVGRTLAFAMVALCGAGSTESVPTDVTPLPSPLNAIENAFDGASRRMPTQLWEELERNAKAVVLHSCMTDEMSGYSALEEDMSYLLSLMSCGFGQPARFKMLSEELRWFLMQTCEATPIDEVEVNRIRDQLAGLLHKILASTAKEVGLEKELNDAARGEIVADFVSQHAQVIRSPLFPAYKRPLTETELTEITESFAASSDNRGARWASLISKHPEDSFERKELPRTFAREVLDQVLKEVQRRTAPPPESYLSAAKDYMKERDQLGPQLEAHREARRKFEQLSRRNGESIEQWGWLLSLLASD